MPSPARAPVADRPVRPGIAGRRRGDPLPAEPAAVVLVGVGGPASPAAVRRAVTGAAGGTVAVVALLRIHGSAWGFPNPGLLPNAREKAAARTAVEATIAAVERAGGHADGQITATRHDARVVAAAARRRGASLVIVERAPAGRVRTIIEGDLGAGVRRRVRGPADRSAGGRRQGVVVEVLDRPECR